eukprot:1962070-Rhodomonas_salina.1
MSALSRAYKGQLPAAFDIDDVAFDLPPYALSVPRAEYALSVPQEATSSTGRQIPDLSTTRARQYSSCLGAKRGWLTWSRFLISEFACGGLHRTSFAET